MLRYVKHVDRLLGRILRHKEIETLRRWGLSPPELSAGISAVRESIAPELEAYNREISSAEMAVSLQSASLLAALCKLTRPARVLDSGSGFSSWVLRRFTQQPDPVEIWSVDDDERWLEATRAYLNEHKMHDQRLLTWNEFAATDERDFDLIFHDLGQAREIRVAVLTEVCERLSLHGLLLLDDFHKRGFRVPARRILRGAGFDVVCLRSLTLDGFGRYAALARRAA